MDENCGRRNPWGGGAIPSVGIYIAEAQSGLSAEQFQAQLAAKRLRTVRQRARAEPEVSWASAMKRYQGKSALPAFPRPPYEPAVQIDVPEEPLVAQWRLGDWHLKRWSQKVNDDTYCVSIWDPGQSMGYTAIGLESSTNIRALDLMGSADVAQGGLNWWLFLRGMYNSYAAEVDPNLGYIFWEVQNRSYARDKTFEEAAFLERVRAMLVMEEGKNLWLARATPRAWLEQGKKISVRSAPTFFGTASYEIVSDVDHGRINATVEMPSRWPPQSVLLRLRHPKTLPIQSVLVNGKPWTCFNRDKETIELKCPRGKITVVASY